LLTKEKEVSKQMTNNGGRSARKKSLETGLNNPLMSPGCDQWVNQRLFSCGGLLPSLQAIHNKQSVFRKAFACL
jgi:hypothetical protein